MTLVGATKTHRNLVMDLMKCNGSHECHQGAIYNHHNADWLEVSSSFTLISNYYISTIKFHQNSASLSNKWSGGGLWLGVPESIMPPRIYHITGEIDTSRVTKYLWTIRVNIPQSSPFIQPVFIVGICDHVVFNRLRRLIPNNHCCFRITIWFFETFLSVLRLKWFPLRVGVVYDSQSSFMALDLLMILMILCKSYLILLNFWPKLKTLEVYYHY